MQLEMQLDFGSFRHNVMMGESTERACEAKTLGHMRWGGFVCKRPAVVQVEGRWACWQHVEKQPHGWV